MNHKFTPPPYSYIHVIDLTRGNWNKPSDVVICEVRCKSAGTVLMQTRNGRTAKRFYNNYDIDRIDVQIIFQGTTSENLYKNKITVAGHYISELSGA